MTSPATDVFLSYKAEDRARLVPLVQALEAEGFTVWWDAHIGGGAHWREDIERHLESAKCVIVAWSKRSTGRDGSFVRDEATRAQSRGVYLPIRIDPVEPPLGFGEVQALPLRGWKGDHSDPRFRAVVDAVRGHISGEHVSHPRVHFDEPRISRRVVIAGGAGVAAVAATGGWFLLRPAPAHAQRIAVLPFANLSGAADQNYFCEGIAEELRGALSRVGLQVVGRTSCDAVKDLEAKAAAAKLGVASLLTGSVRRSPEMLRIKAELVQGSDGLERWAQSYDRAPGDEIEIQIDIATNVLQALSIGLGEARLKALTLGGTSDAAAQDLFLQAANLYYSTSDQKSLLQSIALVDAAIARDPNYAQAWSLKAGQLRALSGFGGPEMTSTLAKGEAAAKRAIALAPTFAPAYEPLAQIQVDRFDFASGVKSMRRGLALGPEQAGTLRQASNFMQLFGDARKALDLVDRAIELDPFGATSRFRQGEVLFTLRQYPRAIDALRKGLELAPQVVDAHWEIGNCLGLMNRFAEAKAEYQKVAADHPLRLTGEAILAARSRDPAAAGQILAHLRELFGETASYQYAQIYAQAHDANRAFAELENAFRAKDPGLQSLRSDPFLDPILSDPRYAALLKRLNFPTWT
jgi:serine/threonine-protein kinase